MSFKDWMESEYNENVPNDVYLTILACIMNHTKYHNQKLGIRNVYISSYT